MARRSSARMAVQGLLLGGVLAGAGPARAEDQGPGAKGLKRLMADTGLKYEWNDEKGVAVVPFSDIKNADGRSVLVYVADGRGYYVKVLLTLIDRDGGQQFPAALLKQAMIRNGVMSLIGLSIDEKNGDLDASIGVDLEGLSAKVLKDYVVHLASVGDELAKELKDYMSP